VALGGRAVKDLYAYSDALYAHQPGDRVEIVFLRDGERRTVTATLGRRGQ
jgi:S1-C subfamily serine protease